MYRNHRHVWGDRPSALAAFACHHLKRVKTSEHDVEILDLGCGYGRDALFLTGSINCRVLGIDNSSEAIDMARKGLAADIEARIEFRCCDFTQVPERKFNVVLASNFYHLLKMEERKALIDVVERYLKPRGMLFLSTLSPNDPKHGGKGKPVHSEANSFVDQRYLHFCTREELEQDFGFLTIRELSEHEYYEPRSDGEVHHHIIWLLMGVNRRRSKAA